MDPVERVVEWLQTLFPKPASFDYETRLRENPLTEPRKNALALTNSFFHITNGPLVRTPLSDVFNIASTQENHSVFCADMEMRMLHCMEQYGHQRGMRMCNGYIQDLTECKYHNYEHLRNRIMMSERKRQIQTGEREVPYEPAPPLDTYK